ncbi:hypothetical protein [Agathobaculum butyriciproducens]|uniref:InlB B-repeat-containing protein n=1 Tax=Agathobaculum butyriciproducens TaxID=1628085 RepID=UPI0036D34542
MDTAPPVRLRPAKTDGNGHALRFPIRVYAFKTWEVIRGGVAITNDTFIMPAKPVTVKAVFRKNCGSGDQPNGGDFNDTETVTLTCDTQRCMDTYITATMV